MFQPLLSAWALSGTWLAPLPPMAVGTLDPCHSKCLILHFRCRLLLCPFGRAGSWSCRVTKPSWPSWTGRNKPGEKAKPRECEETENSLSGSKGSPKISSQQQLCSHGARTWLLCVCPPFKLGVTCLILLPRWLCLASVYLSPVQQVGGRRVLKPCFILSLCPCRGRTRLIYSLFLSFPAWAQVEARCDQSSARPCPVCPDVLAHSVCSALLQGACTARARGSRGLCVNPLFPSRC